MSPTPKTWQLAMDLAARDGEIALVDAGQIIACEKLTRNQRHDVPLIPTLHRLTTSLGWSRSHLNQVYVALGPGSFTGLRIALAAVKMLTRVQPIHVVGVASADLIAFEQPAPDEPEQELLVCLNHKRGSVVASRYAWDASAASWLPTDPPSVEAWDPLIRPVALDHPRRVVTDRLPRTCKTQAAKSVAIHVEPDLDRPRCQALVSLGAARAQANAFDDPARLLPLYVRRPEAVELWEQRQK